jgi:uncharacterized protein (DUF885 family)
MSKMHIHTGVYIAILRSVCLTLCAQDEGRFAGEAAQATAANAPRATTGAADAPRWGTFVDRFIADYFTANPDFATQAGRHEFDGKLPDWSRDGVAREIKRLHSLRDQAAAFDPATLDESARFDRERVLWWIDSDLFWLETVEWPSRNPGFYEWRLSPTVYLTREYAPLDQRLRAYTAYARSIPTAARQIRESLRTPLPLTYIENGRMIFGGLASYYEKDVPSAFAEVKDPELQAQFAAANQPAIAAMKDLDTWLAGQPAQATEAFALGPQRFSEMLRVTEQVETPLDELEQLAQRDLEHNTKALQEACAALAPGKTVAECIALVQAHKPKDALDAARQQLDVLKRFIREQDLVSIPGSEEARVTLMPPFMRNYGAAIDIPGPFDKHLGAYYWIAPPDPNWTEAERQAYVMDEASLLFTSLHEVWPGHFLQYQYANRCSSNLGQLAPSYAYTEGWAHYTEEMMWEAGLKQGDAEAHIGQLLEALFRNVRFKCALGLHTGGMTVAEAEKLFREAAFADPASARQEAARGTFDPGYLNYTLGKLMIRKLRDDWCATRGGRQAWREFHDRLLSFGPAPLPLVRRAMLGPNAGSPF